MQRPVRGPYQTTDFVADRFPKSTHLAIATFFERHVEPAVCALPTTCLDGIEMALAIIEHHTLAQLGELGLTRVAVNAHGILADNFL